MRASRASKRITGALLLAWLGCGAPGSVEVAGPAGAPLPGLDSTWLARFAEGQALFHTEFTPEQGLGPLFNQRRCSSCHDLPRLGGMGEEPITKATRFEPPSRCDLLVAEGGDNIQQRATPPLRELGVEFEDVPASATAVAAVVPPPLYGLGLLEAIPESDLLAREDPDDEDGDGISGRAGRTEAGRIARFGRKAEFATLYDFIEGAIRFEIGLTTPAHPVEESLNGRPVPPASDPVPEPEASEEMLASLTDFVRLLAPPERDAPAADTARAVIRQGERAFGESGCDRCHVPAMRTGPAAVRVMAGKTLRLYSDLLLHDLGAGLATVCGFAAAPSEFRTAPLMGLRLRHKYLHDGRARSIEQAIRLHGGEAERARDAFERLPVEGQHAMIRFLLSL
jgi:CxxC motif-containing protein (DUF1111 family)